MNIRKVIQRRIRQRANGVDIAGDVNAVISANVNERRSPARRSGQAKRSTQGERAGRGPEDASA